MKVYGVSVSYYTGKLEAYLRYKGIEYTMDHPFADQKAIREQTGAIQVPMVQRPDGRWMSDSTPILLQFEQEYPESTILPDDRVVRFIAMLIEDYADEWLWRSAMHYRWSYDHDRELLSRILADEITGHLSAPRFMRVRMVKRRQHQSFVLKDGVTDKTVGHVESGYRAALQNMTDMLQGRPFLLGNAPSIADFGFMGPMLRHFGQDPTPAEIMKNEAPSVFEWLARVWNAKAETTTGAFVNNIGPECRPMLQEIAETHLVQLLENALGYAAGASKFKMTVQGCEYEALPVSRYRVWCLEQLKERFAALTDQQQTDVKALLPHKDAEVLWGNPLPAASSYDQDRQAPFNKAINVYGHGVPD